MPLTLMPLTAYLMVGETAADEALGVGHFIDTICDWVWELCLSLIAERDSLAPDFIAECRRTLRARRSELGQLPQQLLGQELDITGFASRLSRFDGLIADFERIAAAIVPALPHGDVQAG